MRIVAGVDCQKSSHTVGDQRGQRSLPDDVSVPRYSGQVVMPVCKLLPRACRGAIQAG